MTEPTIMRARVWIVLFGILAMWSCASIPRRSVQPPDLAPIGGSPPTLGAKLYAQCVGQAAGVASYDITSDGQAHLLRFTCTGAPARALYVALDAWSAARHSEWAASGRTWRSTGKVVRDLFGVDYCSAGAADYQCAITLNVGGFLVN
jgi:hypothetical protein